MCNLFAGVSSQTCVTECKNCYKNGHCQTCNDGFYRFYSLEKGKNICCPQGCRTCYSDTYCYTCKDGYYFVTNKCLKCFEGCSKCDNYLYECSEQCKPGRWGNSCQYSCTSCSECVSYSCKRHCIEDLSVCDIRKCPNHKCSSGFIGPRKSDTGKIFVIILFNVKCHVTNN